MDSMVQLNPKDDLSSTEAEYKISIAGSTKEIAYPKNKCIHHLFEEQARKTPDNIAVVFDNVRMTYAELDRKSNQLAHHLIAKGANAETLIAICLERSLDMIVGILAILKAGGAYVPIDHCYPKDRIAFMLEDSGCPILVTHSALDPVLPKTNIQRVYLDKDIDLIVKEPETTTNLDIAPGNLAYVIYTSGSTGKPKGVLVEHRNVVRLLFNQDFQFDFCAEDTWTIFHSFCFDFSVWEMYGALLYGGKAVIVPKEAARDPQVFAEIILKENVTVINQTPSAFYNLIPKLLERSNQAFLVRYVIFGGEKLNPVKLKKIKEAWPAVKFINMYGITETTVHVTYKELTLRDIEAGFSNIGKPIPTLRAYIFDENMQLAPIGVEGELCVGGDGVSRGYLNRDELTREKFVPNPLNPEEIIYRSGDLACMRENGDLEYFGRMDSQVQLRGFRIELGEIESVITQINEIEDCVVVVHEDADCDKHLIAYVIFRQNEITADIIREQISNKLPEYMIPSFFISIDQIPLTPNGKLDSEKLPAPNMETISMNNYVAPTNEIENALVQIWSDVLGIEKDEIGIEHNFFEIGGHSLSAATVVQNIKKGLKKEVTIRNIFENPTISKLSKALLSTDKASISSGQKVIKSTKEVTAYPLSGSQLLSWFLKVKFNINTSNVCGIFTLQGLFDFELFQQALSEVAKRHDSLWNPFSPKSPQMQVGKPANYRAEFMDISKDEAHRKNTLLADISDRILHGPFDLCKTPHLRVAVIKKESDTHLLLVSFPHIVSEYSSLNAFVAEVFNAYQPPNGAESDQDALKKTGSIEIVLNEKEFLKSEQAKKSYKFWEEKISGSEFLAFKEEYFADPKTPNPKKLLTQIRFDDQTMAKLQQIAKKTNASVQMVIFSLIKATLHTFSGRNDILVSLILDARGLYNPPPVINLNVTAILVRTQASDMKTYGDLLNHIKWYSVDAHEHMRIPNTLTIPIYPILRKKPFTFLALKIFCSIWLWRNRKAEVDKDIYSSFIYHFWGSRTVTKKIRKESPGYRLAPQIIYNVMPNFYENKIVWSDEKLNVIDFRDRESIMPPRVFNEDSDCQDSNVLNFDLVRDNNNEAILLIWGGRLNEKAFTTMEKIFKDHLKAMLNDISTPIP